MSIGAWAKKQMTPEEKAAAKAEAKAAKSAARKESSKNLKELSKTADAASKKAEASGTLEDHKAAQSAQRAAYNAHSDHYLKYGGIANHDKGSLHRTYTLSHTRAIEDLEKAARDKANKDWEAKQQDPRYQSSRKGLEHEQQGDDAMRRRSNTFQGSKQLEFAKEAFENYKTAHNHYIDSAEISKATSMARAAEHAAGKAGIDFDPEKHPRDEHGRFT